MVVGVAARGDLGGGVVGDHDAGRGVRRQGRVADRGPGPRGRVHRPAAAQRDRHRQGHPRHPRHHRHRTARTQRPVQPGHRIGCRAPHSRSGAATGAARAARDERARRVRARGRWAGPGVGVPDLHDVQRVRDPRDRGHRRRHHRDAAADRAARRSGGPCSTPAPGPCWRPRPPRTARPRASPTSSPPATGPAACGAATVPPGPATSTTSNPGPPGATSPANLGGLCRRHHRLKQRGRWTYALHPDGTVEWTAPTGKQRTTHADHTIWPPQKAPPARSAESTDPVTAAGPSTADIIWDAPPF